MQKLKQYAIALLSITIVIGFSWAFFSTEFFRVHDYTHVARIVEMRRSLDAGHIPVHWTQNFGFGYGMPLFLFYGPLPFYIATSFTYLGTSALMAMKLSFFFSGIVAFLGMYLLMRRFSHTAGLLAATLFFTAPYRAVDLFVRGALNEVWAIGFLPWLVYGGVQIQKNTTRGVAITAAATAAIILTHNLTAFMAIPVLGIFTVLWLWAEKRPAWKYTALFLLSGLLGTAMSLFYILPAFLEKQYTIIESILTGYFNYQHHFLYIRQLIRPDWGYGGSEFGPNDGISFQLGVMALTLILVSLLFLFQALKSAWQQTHHMASLPLRFKKVLQRLPRKYAILVSAGILLALTLFMTLFHSQFLWDTLPLLNYIQFPWRFLGVAIVLSSIIGGLAVSMITITPVRWIVGWMLVLLTVLTTWSYHRPESFLGDANDHYYTDTATIRNNMSSILPDYIPAGFDRDLPVVSEHERIQLDTVDSEFLELTNPHQVLWLGTAPENTTVTWNIAHFPGWKYFINDTEISPTLLEDGRMQYFSENALSSAGAEFTMTPVRSISLLVSIGAWIIWIALLLPKNISKDRHAKF